ncbi:MAG TPA: aldehyde ferredoxin oxidoreductase family protein [Bacillota bacterium]|nr:aldehyde ferredoxin oxidoreductase family protein [Bacillota bacterium]
MSYQGKILRIDLTSGTSRTEELDGDWARQYLGGKGLGARYFAAAVPAGTDPLSPANRVVLMTGPLGGTIAPCTGRLSITTRSPATGTILESGIGGTMGPEIKFAGFDGIILGGRADRLVYAVVDDRSVSLRDAGHLRGKGAHAVELALKSELGGDFRVIAIGQAGENLVPMACLTSELYRQAGRGGAGAVFGAMNLKALCVRGTNPVRVPDIAEFMRVVTALTREDCFSDVNLGMRTDGTPQLVDASNAAGILPTRNFQDGMFEGAGRINSDQLKKHRRRKNACFACTLACGNYTRMGQSVVEGPEYETLALAGSNCGIDDLEAIVRFNAACDDHGIDTISAGNAIAFAMELTERGIHDFGLRFGETELYAQIPRLIALRTGIGAELARGVRHLAERYGGRDFAMEVKGLEVPGYDPRGAWGMGLAYATSDRGACHMRAWPVADEAYGPVDPFTIEGKAELVIRGQHYNAAKFSLIVCDFWAIAPSRLAELATVCVGRKITPEELDLVGERIYNLTRLFNVEAGFRREHDCLPERFFREPLKSGRPAGRIYPRAEFDKLLARYYELRDWDEQGVPREGKRIQLGL